MSGGVSRNSSFMRWARRRQLRVTSRAQATHLLLCGGMLRVTDDETMFELLGKDIEAGEPNYLVEMRTERFKYCQDLDFACPLGVSVRELLEYVSVMQTCLKELFPETFTSDAIVCHAPQKPVTKRLNVVNNATNQPEQRDIDLTKSGYHIIWPRLIVDKSLAIRIRFALKQRLEQSFPNFGKYTFPDIRYTAMTWDEVLDLTIYTQNGLRMVGSSKATRCKSADAHFSNSKNNDDEDDAADRPQTPCEHCARSDGQGNAGYIDQGRPYGIAMVIRPDGSVDKHRTSFLVNHAVEAVRETSIRCADDAPLVGPMHAPSWFTAENEAQMVAATGGGGRARHPGQPHQIVEGGVQQHVGQAGERTHVRVGKGWIECEVLETSGGDERDKRVILYEQFLRDSVIPPTTPGERVSLRKMIISTSIRSPYIFAVTSSKYCINVGREHSGQDVYYVFVGDKVEQRCWSSKEGGGRLHGVCTGNEARAWFRSNGVRMPLPIKQQIFPRAALGGALDFRPDSPPMRSRVQTSPNTNTPLHNRHPDCTPEDIQLMQHLRALRHSLKQQIHPQGHRFSYGPQAPAATTDEDTADDDVEMVFQ